MLQTEQSQSLRNLDAAAETRASPDPFQSTLEFLRRQYRVIALATLLIIALAAVYVLTARPSYTASAMLMIDSKRVQLFQPQSMFSDLPVDASTVESQVEVLKSDTVALAVIKKLNLLDDPEFVGPAGGLIGSLFSLFDFFGSKAPSSEFALTRHAVEVFQHRLGVRRIGLTYVIQISFRSYNPDRAAQIANAIADAYIDDQLESKYQAARRAGVWLQQRLRELRDQASTAERAVVAFKNSNNMVDAGGRTINEQQLAELNSQLVLAQSQTAEARARLDRVQAVLKSNSPEATVTGTVADTLKNDVIIKLRTQYLEMARREVDWATRYGANHLAVVNLRNQMQELQNSIRDELKRIAEGYKSDFEIAKQHEASVQKQLDDAVTQSQVTGKAQVTLRDLESSAQSYRALYDNFLQRYMESVQQQSFPITEARVISAASRPLTPSNPRTRLILMVASAIGVAFGIAAGAWRDLADRVYRTRHQVEERLGTECIALVPKLKESVRKHGKSFATIIGREASGPQKDQTRVGGRDVPLAKQVKLIEPRHRTIEQMPEIFTMIQDAPFSAFAESIRAIKLAIDLNQSDTGCKIIGLTSSIPNEGKSTIAVALARLTAQTGARTLLIDCDLKNPSLSRSVAPKTSIGLVEILGDQAMPQKAVLQKTVLEDPATGMQFLPASTRGRLAHSSEILGAVQMRRLFESLRSEYEYIFADFSPLMPIVDVRAATHLVDGYIYVIEWGKTRIDHVEHALNSARGVYEHLLGVVLNKVDLRSVGRYDGGGSGYYHPAYDQRYGYTE
jgi:succinoglycan biosynthesis transport protein ExoP